MGHQYKMSVSQLYTDAVNRQDVKINGSASFRDDVSITGGPIVSPVLGRDAKIAMAATSLSVGNPTSSFEQYVGAGNPGGGAPANAFSLYGYSVAGVAQLLVSTPAVDVPGTPFGTGVAAPAVLQLTAAQQSGQAVVLLGGQTVVVPLPAITGNAKVLAVVAGLAPDATATHFCVKLNAGVGFSIVFNAPATADVFVDYFIVRL